MNDSILLDIRDSLTGENDYDGFDNELIRYINSSFAILRQLGVGPKGGFRIKDESSKWADYLPEGEVLDMAKEYVNSKCRLKFDPPTSGILMQALKESINEIEQRLYIEVDTPIEDTGGEAEDEFE